MLNPNTPITGRTALFVEIEVRDHEVDTWTIWRSATQGVNVDVLLQQAIDAGFDDIRASFHNTGSVCE